MENNEEDCYCNEDQGAGYTYQDEHGYCDYCLINEKDEEDEKDGKR